MARNEQTAGDGEGMKPKRRSFLRKVMWSSAALVLLEAVGAGLALFWPRKIEGFGSVIKAGKVSDFPVPSITKFRDGKFYISRLPDGNVMALYWKCPHLGCTVPWVPEEDKFHCPCHGSIYLRNGQNVAGPAPRPMDFMHIDVRGEELFVDTGDITERPVHKPEHETSV